MKKIALALMACVSFSFINASISMDDKIYVSSRDVMVADNGIYVNLDGTLVEVEALGHDAVGINISPSSIKDTLPGREACDQCQAAKKKKAEEEQKRLEEEKKKLEEQKKQVPQAT